MVKKYTEDCSIQGRRSEIYIKDKRIYEMLDCTGNEALFLLKHPNFSWVTAGGKNFVANCFDNGTAAILVTRDAKYVICNIIEATRLTQEECLQELGFELLQYGWEEDRMLDIVLDKVKDISKVVSDTAMGEMNCNNSLINPMRLCLTENEIARYMHLGKTLSQTLEEYIPTIHPGMTELEISGGIAQCLWKYDIEQVMILVSVDERTCKFRHALPTNKKLKHNIIVSVNGRYKGLITTISRMAYFGEPEESFVQQYNNCVEMECRTVAKAQIGADELDMYNELKRAYVDMGYPTMFEKHGQGGCQGYYPRDYMVTPTSHNIIKENQAYCFNPVVDGTKSEDAFIVTAEGPVFITFPVSYPTITFNVDGKKFVRPALKIII